MLTDFSCKCFTPSLILSSGYLWILSLSVPVAVKDPLLKDSPTRKGFTVVEWGVARR
ncbi:MAG: hypothetical protein N2558_02465 [Patescibacteria group bacterium]|nr:hypothetical protein [Patescibacteria group bacterium]